MKERPILFSSAMVRALLAGTKTQTRRLAKGVVAQHAVTGAALATLNSVGPRVTCPYGQPGDRLWVRETFRGVVNIAPPGSYKYAVARYVPDREHCRRVEYAATHGADGEPWRPSTNMPRWASRITLEVTGVRVERLQDISEADAEAEGATPAPDPCDHVRRACADIGCSGPQPHRVGFRTLWQDINGPSSWAANPWVWVIEFRRLA